jgi:hypothetical protein
VRSWSFCWIATGATDSLLFYQKNDDDDKLHETEAPLDSKRPNTIGRTSSIQLRAAQLRRAPSGQNFHLSYFFLQSRINDAFRPALPAEQLLGFYELYIYLFSVSTPGRIGPCARAWRPRPRRSKGGRKSGAVEWE